MLSDDALLRLKTMLQVAGVNLDSPDATLTWAVFREFAREPVEDIDQGLGGDMLLAEYGVYGWNGAPPTFQVDLTRHFSFLDDEGEYAGMTRLSCTFHFAVEDAVAGLNESLESGGEMAVDEFFDQALMMPGFEWAGQRLTRPLRLELHYEDV